MKIIGILTFHRACNFGAVLQAYALQTAINKEARKKIAIIVDYRCPTIENSYNPWCIEKTKSSPYIIRFLKLILLFHAKFKKRRLFLRFTRQYLQLTASVNKQNINNIINNFSVLIAGSDQIWNLELTNGDTTYLLDFNNKEIKRFSYAASFGHEDQLKRKSSYISLFLDGYSKLSFRESNIQKLCTSIYPKLLSRVDLDPTLLLTAEEWLMLASQETLRFPYILIYIIQPSNQLVEFARKLSQKTKMRLIYLEGSYKQDRDIKHIRGRSPGQFLSLIANAAYVLTTSFHGLAFSLLFNKMFFVETENGNEKNERIDSLLTLVDCQDRVINGSTINQYEMPINWEDVKERLQVARIESLNYLRSIISTL